LVRLELELDVAAAYGSVVNKDLTFKAKAKAKDLTLKPRTKAKDNNTGVWATSFKDGIDFLCFERR